MKYKNTKTGAIIDSPCKISGGDWIKYTEEVRETQVDDQVEETKEIEKEIEELEEEKIDGIDGITVKEIKQELDAFGIKYDPRAKKQELYDLMMQGR